MTESEEIDADKFADNLQIALVPVTERHGIEMAEFIEKSMNTFLAYLTEGAKAEGLDPSAAMAHALATIARWHLNSFPPEARQ